MDFKDFINEQANNMKNGKGKNVVFDFDGVMHPYKRGWEGAENINEGPTPGIEKVIKELRDDGYRIVIMSTRASDQPGRIAINNWLEKYEIEVDEITWKKVPAIVYIDDRAIQFTGDTKTLKEQIDNFVPWTNRKYDGNKDQRF